MKRLLIISLLFLTAACGPKEIGEGTSLEASAPHEAVAADQMRLPMTGASHTERMLYYYNHPENMERIQNWNVTRYNKMMGLQPSPEDPAYRAVPKQRSPFRQ